jgi:cephalosporin hydroxylase
MNNLEAMSQYDLESADNIRQMYADESVRLLSQQWINATGPYKYVYNWKWHGRPIIQLPADILLTQELIYAFKPDIIVETGIARGGSIVFNASQLAMLELCEKQVCDIKMSSRFCIGIDIDIRDHNRQGLEEHPLFPMIRLVQGSSVDASTVNRVKSLIPESSRVMVILDSNHTHSHVHCELQLFSDIVTPGMPLIVHDTGIEYAPPELFEDRNWGKGNNPMSAVQQFLFESPNFERLNLENMKLLITSSPQGYLKRAY